MSEAKVRLARRIRDAALVLIAAQSPVDCGIKITLKFAGRFRNVYVSTLRGRQFAFSWWYTPFGKSYGLTCFKNGPWVEQLLEAARDARRRPRRK